MPVETITNQINNFLAEYETARNAILVQLSIKNNGMQFTPQFQAWNEQHIVRAESLAKRAWGTLPNVESGERTLQGGEIWREIEASEAVYSQAKGQANVDNLSVSAYEVAKDRAKTIFKMNPDTREFLKAYENASSDVQFAIENSYGDFLPTGTEWRNVHLTLERKLRQRHFNPALEQAQIDLEGTYTRVEECYKATLSLVDLFGSGGTLPLKDIFEDAGYKPHVVFSSGIPSTLPLPSTAYLIRIQHYIGRTQDIIKVDGVPYRSYRFTRLDLTNGASAQTVFMNGQQVRLNHG